VIPAHADAEFLTPGGVNDDVIAVGEALNVGLAEGLVEMVADAFRQSGIGVSGEYLDFFAV